MAVLEGHKDLYRFGQNVPMSSSLLLVLPALFCSMGYKQAREGADPKPLVKKLNGVDTEMFRCYLLSSPRSLSFRGRPTFPFIDEEEDIDYTREREISEGEEGFRHHGALHFLHAAPTDPIDHDGDNSMSLLYLSLALYADVISWPWRSIPCGMRHG